MLSPRQFNLLLTWVRPKLGSIWLMVRADKRYGFDVIPDLRLETELDPSRWALLCNTTGHGVTRKKTEEGYRFSHMLTLGEKMTGRERHELCIKSGVERTKENSVKLELAGPRGDKWADWGGWYSMIGHGRCACYGGRGLSMSSCCLEVRQNHVAWNSIHNNYKLHSFVLISLSVGKEEQLSLYQHFRWRNWGTRGFTWLPQGCTTGGWILPKVQRLHPVLP